MESTVVDISIPPPYFKPVSLYLSRSLLSKTPKQVFFNPINILTLLPLCSTITNLLFSFNIKFIFTGKNVLVGCVDGWVRMFDIRDERSGDQRMWEQKVIEGEALTVMVIRRGHLAFGTENGNACLYTV